jgi:hypothetical protein
MIRRSVSARAAATPNKRNTGRQTMRVVLAVLFSSGLLAACGGGGSSDAGGKAAPLLVINTSNQQAVGRATATASAALVGAGGGVSGANAADGGASALSVSRTSSALPGGSLGAVAMYLGRALDNSTGGQRSVLAASRAGGSARALAVAPQTELCTLSGSVTVGLVDADNSGSATLGDTLTLTFNHCEETATESVNGVMSITFSQVNMPSGLLSFTGTLAMQSLTVVDGTRTSLLNGGLTMAFVQMSTTMTQVGMVVGNSGLSTSVTGPGVSESIAFDAGFALEINEQTATTVGDVSSATAKLTGTFNATSIGGRVQISTPTPLLQLATDSYPRAGALKVLGNASALRLTALDATTARIELDANLDGTYESSTDLPWTTLLPG